MIAVNVIMCLSEQIGRNTEIILLNMGPVGQVDKSAYGAGHCNIGVKVLDAHQYFCCLI